MQKLYVTPTDFREKIGSNVLDDGSSVEIIFADGEYDWTSFVILKPSGGSLVLRAQNSRQARITNGSMAAAATYLVATSLTLSGFAFYGSPYLTTDPAAFKYITLYLGALSPTGVVCAPTSIIVEDLYATGATLTFLLYPSHDPLTYTSILVQDIDLYENGHNGEFGIWSQYPYWASGFVEGLGGYCHARIRNFNGNGLNGPDGPNWGNLTPSSHHSGPATLEFTGLSGYSTVEVHASKFFSEIRGSYNHDLHNFRINAVLSPNVSFLFRDCLFEGLWSERHFYGDGGGLSHLGYYHPNGPRYIQSSHGAPTIDFENCHFKTTIASTVSTDEAALGWVRKSQFWLASPATYRFYDTLFEWDIKREEYRTVLPTYGPSLVSAGVPSTHEHHNSTFIDCKINPGTLPVLEDSFSYGYTDRTYRRSPPVWPIPDDYPLLPTPYFRHAFETAGWWDLTDHCSRELVSAWPAPAWPGADAEGGSYFALVEGAGAAVLGGPYSANLLSGPITLTPSASFTLDLAFNHWSAPGQHRTQIFLDPGDGSFIEILNVTSGLSWHWLHDFAYLGAPFTSDGYSFTALGSTAYLKVRTSAVATPSYARTFVDVVEFIRRG